jgi:hypothetical protein
MHVGMQLIIAVSTQLSSYASLQHTGSNVHVHARTSGSSQPGDVCGSQQPMPPLPVSSSSALSSGSSVVVPVLESSPPVDSSVAVTLPDCSGAPAHAMGPASANASVHQGRVDGLIVGRQHNAAAQPGAHTAFSNSAPQAQLSVGNQLPLS